MKLDVEGYAPRESVLEVLCKRTGRALAERKRMASGPIGDPPPVGDGDGVRCG